MKLAQNQVWQQGDDFIRIVVLERLKVEYKSVPNLLSRDGKHQHVSKKEFCRLIKGARLMTQEEQDAIQFSGASAVTPGAAIPPDL